jgi:hypothetical protein
VYGEDYVKLHEVGREQWNSQIHARSEWIWKFERRIRLEMHFLEKLKNGNLRDDQAGSPTSPDTLLYLTGPLIIFYLPFGYSKILLNYAFNK